MLKLSLVAMFVFSLATLSLAASYMPLPETSGQAVATAGLRPWITTFE